MLGFGPEFSLAEKPENLRSYFYLGASVSLSPLQGDAFLRGPP